MRVALVTARAYADLDRDLPQLSSALAATGHEASVVGWDEAAVNWGSYDGVVIRSPWDYIGRREEFLEWATSVERITRLANPAAVLRWNSDKRYLTDLASGGVPLVPTAWPASGDSIPAEWTDLVVKPAISAGGRWTGRYDDAAAAAAFARQLQERGDIPLVQPYLPVIDREGEIGVVFFNGAPSHAVRKSAILPERQAPVADHSLAAGQTVAPVPLREAPVDFARAALSLVPHPGPLLYARVDCVSDASGGHVLLELEVFEPALFVDLHDGAAMRFAVAVDTWLRR